jgi:hypothetical protein
MVYYGNTSHLELIGSILYGIIIVSGVDEQRNLLRKERTMKRGHVTGHKKERKGAQDWYRQIEEEHIRRIEAERQAKQASK